ncbi:MAG TPA: hypothetical protein VHH36_02035 [Candidatus Thermoplasmatota archaeon]|nr:hypothetical protein [Candidatus Thermoplasmatota archaeon]
MRSNSILIAAAILLAVPAAAHFPPAPDTNCNSDAGEHDFVGASSATTTTGITGEFGGGITIVFDGSLLPCGTEDFCPPGEDFFVFDPSGDDLPDGTDPSGDNVVVPCEDILVGGTQVPIGDGEFEFGLSGAFLPASHHDPLTDGYTVTATFTDGGFIFGSDADDDGDVEEGAGDCFESHASVGTYTTACAAGADGGWWLFTKCNAATLHDWAFTTNGPLLRLGLGDDDGDDIPNSLEDGDSDGVPNGLDDSDTSDDFVNVNWNPTLTPGTLPPDASANCLTSGHVHTIRICEPACVVSHLDFFPPAGVTIHRFPTDLDPVGRPKILVLPSQQFPAWTCDHNVGDYLTNGETVTCTPPPPPAPFTRNVCAKITAGGYATSIAPDGWTIGTTACGADGVGRQFNGPVSIALSFSKPANTPNPTLKCTVSWNEDAEAPTDDWWFHCGMNEVTLPGWAGADVLVPP